ncbi:RING domain-containing protein [Cryptosporidium canis]|uniref:RING domain-containing protein n=1 Tax=Cryptosporidium canis TaxID=195482 RepID=A0ABQ8PC16_9CRYT|nr:RING domain-containing protein [Cryptosporidium canis]
MEIYFLVPNLASIYSGKEWVRVVLNENIGSEIKSIGRSNSTEGQVIDGIGLDKNGNILVMLVKDPKSHIVISSNFVEKSVPDAGLRGSGRNLRSEKVLNHHFKSINVAAKQSIAGDRLLLRKDQCNCPILEDSLSAVTDDESGRFYSLKLDGQNSVSNPIFIQSISLIFMLLKWIILLGYILTQLLLPLDAVKRLVDEKLLKSSAISIFYVIATSLSLSVVGMEGMDCINWWFIGSSPEYLLATQVFTWLIASVCILLYLIQSFLEVAFNISRRYKLLNDFITTFIFIPAGLLIVISVSLCILGIIKPWLLMVWLTVVFIEFEKNLRILAKVYDENTTSNTEVSSNRNSSVFHTTGRISNSREEISNEINIVELKDGLDSRLESKGDDKLMLNSNNKNDMVIIPISNSYFKILDSRYENFSTKLCLWYITQHKEMDNGPVFNIEMSECLSSNILKIFEFSISGITKYIDFDKDIQCNNLSSNCSEETSCPSDSRISRISSFLTEDTIDSTNNQFICNICFLDFDSIVIFSPCGHGNVCLECLGDYISNNFKLKQQPKCHICREDISRMIEIRKDIECKSDDKVLLEESVSFESTVSKRMNASNQISERKIHLISNVKLIAEITCNKRNSDISTPNTINRSDSTRSSSSNIITLKISRKNSNLWSHPRIKEFIENSQENQLRTWIHSRLTRTFPNSRRRLS